MGLPVHLCCLTLYDSWSPILCKNHLPASNPAIGTQHLVQILNVCLNLKRFIQSWVTSATDMQCGSTWLGFKYIFYLRLSSFTNGWWKDHHHWWCQIKLSRSPAVEHYKNNRHVSSVKQGKRDECLFIKAPPAAANTISSRWRKTWLRNVQQETKLEAWQKVSDKYERTACFQLWTLHESMDIKEYKTQVSPFCYRWICWLFCPFLQYSKM